MANEVLLGLKIGGVVSGSFNAAFGTAKSTVQQLGRATDGLAVKQQAVGNALSASLARGGTGLVQLRRQYDALGNTIDQLKAKQDRLTASIERGAALKNQRRELRGQAMEVIGTGVALGAPVLRSFNTAVDFQDQTRDIAITGGFNTAQEQRLSLAMRSAALRWNQTQTEVANGTAILIAGGIDSLKELAAYAPVMAKTATATRASMKDLGSVAIALNDNLGIGAAGLERSMNMLAFAGKSGQFELADMAKWLPQLTPQFAALGITGKRAVAEIGAALQIARRGAGSNDEAANNYKNFLSKITAPETLKAFEKAGIDLKGSMRNLVSEGLSPAQAMLNILTAHLGKKAPTAAAEYGKALDIKDEQERAMALARLDEVYKLGALFADQQVLSFVRPALANQKDLASIEQDSKSAADQGLLDQDWAKRMGSSKEQLKELRNNLTDVGLSVGSALLPAIVDVSRAVVPLMRSFSAWAEQHPDLIRGVVGLVGGLLLGKLAFIGVAYGAHLVMAPFVALTTTVTTLSAKWAMLRAMWQMGKFTPLITGLRRSGAGLLKVARGALHLGKMLGGTLWVGLKLVGQAVLWLGRALMLNPIGLAITGIALAAYLIYRHWAPIKTFFTGLWNEVRAGFDGGLSGILAVLLNFSPLGLFYRAFSGVMNYFGIELPGRFTEFGGLLVTGLVNGIGNMAGGLKDSVVGIGASVKDWFTETLGIESPSRVFIGYGANISEGAALGIKAQSGLVRQAARSMAAQSAVDMAPPNPAQVTRASMLGATGARSAASESAGPMTFHFSPQINVPSGAGMEQINQGLHASYAEWVRLMERYLHDKRRHSYGPANEVTA
ncbi:phage tail tape measure protein [Pseudomonas kilonensis]|uniref:phage tail tape measure protein n=1 Tax=Pseudomonas kilonensis TaxID=132476 RepID=UPI00209F0ECB|nr:phage tail tape measure protein [Pseudomonas kilonensis]MCP1456998.1 TP901 family phage tail tape measure protein [Pseudomonas kilonensis]